MAKTGTTVKGAKTRVMNPSMAAEETIELQQVFKVTDSTNEAEIMRADGMPGVRLEFDFVHFRKLDDSFVANLRAQSQKAYWLAFSEWDDRSRRSNIAMHEIGVDPLTKILDRPRGRNNPLVKDGEKVQKLLGRDWYVTWRIQGGEGDLEGAKEVGFKVIRKPASPEEERTKPPLEWNGEEWKILDGTKDPNSGDMIYNVMVCIRRKVWEDHLKAMSMASHNAYSQNKREFVEGADNISRDMLSAKEKVVVTDLDEMHAEESTIVQEGRRVHVNP